MTASGFETLLYSTAGSVATITLNRPDQLNTIVPPMPDEIEAAIDEIIAKNPEKVAQAKEKPTLLGWFVGQTMKATGGKANPAAVNGLLKAKLGIE